MIAGKVALDQESLYTAIAKHQRHQYQQNQHEQHQMDPDYDAARSLLDVDDLPLTFALDTQMLPLPTVPKAESTWTSRLFEFMVFGS